MNLCYGLEKFLLRQSGTRPIFYLGQLSSRERRPSPKDCASARPPGVALRSKAGGKPALERDNAVAPPCDVQPRTPQSSQPSPPCIWTFLISLQLAEYFQHLSLSCAFGQTIPATGTSAARSYSLISPAFFTPTSK